jgi:hypothetical protein
MLNLPPRLLGADPILPIPPVLEDWMFQSTIEIAVLMRLAAADPEGATEHLAKVYEWKYAEATTIAKAVVGTGSALALLPLLPLIQPIATAPLSLVGVLIILGSALTLILLGSGLFVAARRLHLEFLAAQTLLGHLVEIHPFLGRYQETQS